VSLVAAAVCPHPPLIVPAVASGAAAELDDLRRACDQAVERLREARPDEVVIVGGGDRTGLCDPDRDGSLAGFGVDLGIPLRPARRAGRPGLPLSVTLGAWLLGRRPPGVTIAAATVDAGAPTRDCAAFGAALAGRAERVALLVMGDGSACRGVRAPGHDDPRAAPYDRVAAKALAAADVDGLLALDERLSAELLAGGRAAWQALAGAARAAGGDWTSDLGYEDAPYGVAYFVAFWARS
jgi:hypothetical protein